MPVITKIEKHPQKSNLYNIYVDGQFFTAVDDEAIINFRLKNGAELSASELEQLLDDKERQKAESYALKLLALRPYAEKEIRDRLVKKGCSPYWIEKVLGKLKKQGHLDDAQFSRQWADSRFLYRNYGKRRIQYELRQKGVAERDIEAALTSITPEDEKEQAMSIAQKKWRQIRYTDTLKAKQKLFRFLTNRGYSRGTVMEVLNHFDTLSDSD